MQALPVQVRIEMAKREHRLSHYLWHGLRTSWERLDEGQKNYIRSIDPDWEPPRPARDKMRRAIRSNNSGEDFLFMHREMIKMANKILLKVSNPSYPKVEGWNTLPEPSDNEYPIVSLPDAVFERQKSDDYFHGVMKKWEVEYKSEEYLRSVTLGELGTDLEFSIHDAMHMRWCTPSPVGVRPQGPIREAIDIRWDDVEYDYLGDTYSSHVHSTFWKIHGWVDDRIEDWKRVHQISTIKWKGTWVGPKHHHHEHHHFARDKKVKKAVFQKTFDKMHEIAKLLGEVEFDGFLKELEQAPQKATQQF
jgi:hypothetical protein